MFHFKYVTCDTFVWVCLCYSHTVYPQVLPKHNKKLLTLLFSHIISIKDQNYNLFTFSITAILAKYLHVITRTVLQLIH